MSKIDMEQPYRIAGVDCMQKLRIQDFTEIGYWATAQILPNKTIAVRGVSEVGYVG